MNGEHTCTFVEEREPSGRLIVGPCLGCTKPAFSALADAQAMVEALQAQLEELKANRVPHSMQHVIELQAMNNRLGAEVEALQKKYDDLLGKYRQLVDFYDKHNGTPCEQIRHQQQVDALQRVRDEFERERDQLHAALMEAKAALDAEREKVKDFEAAAGAMSCKEIADKVAGYTQLKALVRALPVVRIDINGAYHDTLLARPEDGAVKELLRYRAGLDATTPDSNQLGDINDMVSKGGDGE